MLGVMRSREFAAIPLIVALLGFVGPLLLAIYTGPAQEHLGTTLDALDRIGSHDPIQAADDGLREFPADLTVFATGPADQANRLERDLVEVAGSRYDISVAQIGADPAGRG
jgi:hypothetical protein